MINLFANIFVLGEEEDKPLFIQFLALTYIRASNS